MSGILAEAGVYAGQKAERDGRGGVVVVKLEGIDEGCLPRFGQPRQEISRLKSGLVNGKRIISKPLDNYLALLVYLYWFSTPAHGESITPCSDETIA